MSFHFKSLRFRKISWWIYRYRYDVSFVYNLYHVNPKTSTVNIFISESSSRYVVWDINPEWGRTYNSFNTYYVHCKRPRKNISFFIWAPRMMVLNLTNKFNENENHFPRIFCENLKNCSLTGDDLCREKFFFMKISKLYTSITMFWVGNITSTTNRNFDISIKCKYLKYICFSMCSL